MYLQCISALDNMGYGNVAAISHSVQNGRKKNISQFFDSTCRRYFLQLKNDSNIYASSKL